VTESVKSVFEMQILVRSGSGGWLPPHATGGEALCYVGAEDHLEAFSLAVEELNSRGVVVESLVGNSVGLLDLSKWNEHADDISSQASARFGDTAESARERLPGEMELRQLARNGGFLLGLFYCWDSEPHPGSGTDSSACDGLDLSDEQISQHDELFRTGRRLIKDLVGVEDLSHKPLNVSERKRLRKAVKAFEQALAIIPTNWRAMVLMGKALQSLGDNERALEVLLRANDCVPDEFIPALEAGTTAGRLGRHDVAIRVMESAFERHPDDSRLPFNLCLSYLFSRDVRKARRAIDRAIALEPQRDENKRLQALLMEIESGTRPCPENEAELAQMCS
jgi:tetratricopeptide (TPR) repeat protein